MTERTPRVATHDYRSAHVADVCGSLTPDLRQQQALENAAKRLRSSVDQGWHALASSDNASNLQAYAAELHEIDQLLGAVAESTHHAAGMLKSQLDEALWNVLREETGLKPGDIFEQAHEATGHVARVRLEEIALWEPNRAIGTTETQLVLRGPLVDARGRFRKRTETVFIKNFDAIAHLTCVQRPPEATRTDVG